MTVIRIPGCYTHPLVLYASLVVIRIPGRYYPSLAVIRLPDRYTHPGCYAPP